MKKIAILILSILIAGLFVACNQDITVDAQTYANMEVGTFVLNGQNYATLQAAVDAIGSKAAGDNVIKLTRNASGPGAKIASKDVTIDFQGFTYSFTNVNGLQGQDVTGKDFGLSITSGSDVVLKGLQKIDLNDKTTTDLTMVYVEGATTSLTIEDAPKMEVANSQYVFWAANGATLTIGSTTTTTEKTEITGKIAATGTSTNKPVVSFNNDTKINASELKADSAVVVINTLEDSTIGSFVASNEATVVVSGAGDVVVDKNDSPEGATYEVQNTSSEATVTVKTEEGPDQTLNPGYAEKVINGEPQVPTETDYVAMIGNTLYKTLQKAFDEVTDNETIILLKDVSYTEPIGFEKDIVASFDLNSKTLKVTGGDGTYGSGRAIKILAGNLTIENGVIDGRSYNSDGTLNPHSSGTGWSDTRVGGCVRVCKSSSATLKNLTMYNNDSWGSGVLMESTGVLTVEDCNFNALYGAALICGGYTHQSLDGDKATTYIYGSHFVQEGAAIDEYNFNANCIATMYGGIIEIHDSEVETEASGTDVFASYTSGGKISVYGGDYTGTRSIINSFGMASSYTSTYAKACLFNLYDGTYHYNGSDYPILFSNEPAGTTIYHNDDVQIFGGTYNFDPSSATTSSSATITKDFVAEGYKAKDNGDGTWTVSELDHEEVEVVEDGVKMSLVDFAKSVNSGNNYEGKTVKLLKDVDLAGIAWTPIGNGDSDKMFRGTFEGQNKTISNLTVNSSAREVGFFGTVYGATIKNIVFKKASITGTNKYTAVLVGLVGPKDASPSTTIPNTSVMISNIDIDKESVVVGSDKAGAIAGQMFVAGGSIIENISSYASITGDRVGGVMGAISFQGGGTIIFENCQIGGTITTQNTTTSWAGGIIGHKMGGSHFDSHIISFDRCNVPGLEKMSGGDSAKLGTYIGSADRGTYEFTQSKVGNSLFSTPIGLIKFTNGGGTAGISIESDLYCIAASASSDFGNTVASVQSTVVGGYERPKRNDNNEYIDNNYYLVSNMFVSNHDFCFNADGNAVLKVKPSSIVEGTKIQRGIRVAGYDYSYTRYAYTFDRYRVVTIGTPESEEFVDGFIWLDDDNFRLGEGTYYYLDPTPYVDLNIYSVTSNPSESVGTIYRVSQN